MKYGCTTCFDHHYLFPEKAEETLIDEQFNSAKELGIRFHASRGSMNLSKKDGGLPPDSVVQKMDKILYDSERIIKKYHDAMRPLEYMETLNWIGNDVWYAHGIHFNTDELKVLAKTQTGVAHCPISNMKLSSGIARIPEMINLDVPVGLAVDGSASNDGSNLLEELRVCYLLHRLNWSNKAPTGYDILKLATKGSARVLGRKDLGELSVGKAADLFMINSNRIEFIGAEYDPKSILGTVGCKAPVDYTIIAGKVVVKDGKLTTIDEEKTVFEARKAVENLFAKI